MSQSQPPLAAMDLPLRPLPPPAPIQFPPRPPQPPRTGDTKSDSAATLAWLKTSLETIYLAGRRSPDQDSPPKLALSAYLDMYSTTADYCEAAKQFRRGRSPPYFDDLYNCLQDTIRTHCNEIRSHLFASRNSTGIDDARRLIGEYLVHWNMLARLAALIKNVMRYFESWWIKRYTGEGRQDIYFIRDLHTVVWKEAVLYVGVEVAGEATRAELDRAVGLLQKEGQGGIESDNDLVWRFMESFRAVGLPTVLVFR